MDIIVNGEILERVLSFTYFVLIITDARGREMVIKKRKRVAKNVFDKM